MRKILQKITHPFLKLMTKIWFSKPRKYAYDGIEVLVHPDVFPPHYTISTKILLDFISTLKINKKSFLELGCGSGIISLFAASKGAKVTATDINHKALKYLKQSAKTNNISIEVFYSDLFSAIKKSEFDYIFINPPYYPKSPSSIKEQAWFCGENFEYFYKLFEQLSQRKKNEQIFMILSEDCQIDTIQKIASNYSLIFEVISEKKVLQERNFIFNISS